MWHRLPSALSKFRRGRVRPGLELLEDRTVPTTGFAVNFGADNVLDVAVDDLGNSYATGTFQGTADFDPGPGVATLTSAGNTDSFVAKYAADGSFLWAQRMGGTGADSGTAT